MPDTESTFSPAQLKSEVSGVVGKLDQICREGSPGLSNPQLREDLEGQGLHVFTAKELLKYATEQHGPFVVIPIQDDIFRSSTLKYAHSHILLFRPTEKLIKRSQLPWYLGVAHILQYRPNKGKDQGLLDYEYSDGCHVFLPLLTFAYYLRIGFPGASPDAGGYSGSLLWSSKNDRPCFIVAELGAPPVNTGAE